MNSVLNRDNVLQRLDEYLKKNKTLVRVTKTDEGFKLWYDCRQINEDIYSLAQELGYDLILICKRKPREFYDNFDSLADTIEALIRNKYKRFPKVDEIKTELHISSRLIKKYGGIKEIKKRMGYTSPSDLIDSSGHFNNSVWELMVANFLYHNKIECKRNQLLFQDKRYTFRSDFTFTLPNTEILHVELWGYPVSSSKEWVVTRDYLKQREEKEKIYKDNRIPYISIEGYEILYNKTFPQIQENLINVFSFLNVSLNKIDPDLLCSINHINEDTIIEKVMSYSNDPTTLPSSSVVLDNDISLILYIKSRYGGWIKFARKINKQTVRLDDYWSQDKVLELFEQLFLQYNYIPSYDYMRKHASNNPLFAKVIKGLYRFPNFINLKLKFYQLKVTKNIKIPARDICWLVQISECTGNISPHINENHNKNAKNILDSFSEETIKNALNLEQNKREAAFRAKMFNLFNYIRKQYGCILMSYGKYTKLRKSDSFLKKENLYFRSKTIGKLRQFQLEYIRKVLESDYAITEEEKLFIKQTAKGLCNNQYKPTTIEVQLAQKLLSFFN
ncbi:hypothetical protein JOC86_000471 [Bacillus pakistanensis]|uniref:Uncharacterized protein n=1 Tax=Rossellomorea pakistanensis TaxID=992288 RepID=A0ABS2N7Y3_9BACI|nr:hypothetical protein [Bacillus pakistanensis]MBM7583934.1 hypothetical protein [Bacillus pakistanensis]